MECFRARQIKRLVSKSQSVLENCIVIPGLCIHGHMIPIERLRCLSLGVQILPSIFSTGSAKRSPKAGDHHKRPGTKCTAPPWHITSTSCFVDSLCGPLPAIYKHYKRRHSRGLQKQSENTPRDEVFVAYKANKDGCISRRRWVYFHKPRGCISQTLGCISTTSGCPQPPTLTPG